MKTTFRTESSRLACANCSTISPALKFPSSPSVPVAQNVHPILHPTCDDTHSVVRPLACRITHASTRCPSRNSTIIFFVEPSADVFSCATRVTKRANAPPSPPPFPTNPSITARGRPNPGRRSRTSSSVIAPSRAHSTHARARFLACARALNPSPPRARIHSTSFSRSNTLDVDTTDDDDDKRASFLSPLIPRRPRARATRRRARESPAAGAVGRSPGRSVAGKNTRVYQRRIFIAVLYVWSHCLHTRETEAFSFATLRTRPTDRVDDGRTKPPSPVFVRGFRPLHRDGTGCPSRADRVVSTRENACPEKTTRAATGTTRRVRKRARGERAFFSLFSSSSSSSARRFAMRRARTLLDDDASTTSAGSAMRDDVVSETEEGDGTMFAMAILAVGLVMCWMVFGLVSRRRARERARKATEAFERALEASERARKGEVWRAWEDRAVKIAMPGSMRGEEVVVLGVREVLDARGAEVRVGEEANAEAELRASRENGGDETRGGDAARVVETTVVGSNEAV